MIQSARNAYNAQFTEEKYRNYIDNIHRLYPNQLDFRVAETPVFISKEFCTNMLTACEAIIDIIADASFKEKTESSIPEKYYIPGEDEHPQCLVFDFGICKNESGETIPQLIEMQGFPSLFAWQIIENKLTQTYAAVNEHYSSFLNNYNEESYIQLLKDILIGNENPINVVLLEIYPNQQKTKIDFVCTRQLLGIETICLTQLKADGKQLFYEKNGERIEIKRIFHRVIFDDVAQQKNMPPIIDLKQEYNVEWIPHPHWFYRISKYTLPFIQHPFVPETFFLNEVKQPLPLEKYVLKPLFSFAGNGVVIDVTQHNIDNIENPENWILQKKVEYAAVIPTMDEPAKAEIRLFYFWKNDWERPLAVHNLARLSKGKMIGTRYNQDKTWVGGTIAYFEK